MKSLIIGGAGFIGSAVIRHIPTNTDESVVNLANLTYAGNLESLNDFTNNNKYVFEHANICDKQELDRIFNQHQPDIVPHLAANNNNIEALEFNIPTSTDICCIHKH